MESLKETVLLQVYDGLDLDKKRNLVSKLLESAQIVSFVLPTADQMFAKFLGREFMHITFDIYNKANEIWLRLKEQIVGASRIRNNIQLIVWNKPDDNYKNTDHAIVYKDQILQNFLEDGHPRGLLICFNENEVSSFIEVFNSKDPLTFLEQIGW